ncbi:MAG: hypothetical protein IJH09_04535 [Clostridia bacterium]|nr:hypothetical protein [Clostridia bacterium]
MRNKDGLLARRIAMAAVGMALAGVAVGLFKRAMFGVDPYQAFANGLANVIPIRFGTLYMLVNALQLVVVFFLDRHYIGISTLINLFLLGYVAEYTELGLARWLGEPTLAGQVAFLIVGIVLSCFAAALYYTADLGVSTYDAIPLHISDRKPRLMGRVLPFRAIRIISDLICTGIGAALGAPVGLGTVITALFMGPLIAFFRRTVSDPLLERGRKAA